MLGDKYFIDIALRTAEESKCVSLKVGAVIVKDKRIIAQGYNGTPSGQLNCNEALEQGLYKREHHHEWSLVNEIHAEMNALMFAAKYGIPVEGCTMYVTHQPCDQCIKNIYQAGIKRVVYVYPYQHSTTDNIFMNLEGMKVERYGEPEQEESEQPEIEDVIPTEPISQDEIGRQICKQRDDLWKKYMAYKMRGDGIACQRIYAILTELNKKISDLDTSKE